MANYNYPKSPEAKVNELLALPPSYRKHVFNTLLSTLVFIIGYFFILAASLALLYFGAKLALVIITTKAHWVTLVAAAGIMMVVIMVFIFITKFLFKVHKESTEGKLEIKREEHPLLFDFIERICKETKAPFPKKIILSSDVNACVYYNSSFLSMFFPARKNLEIGLGLVNCVNITEFKAILAHEFGHFSQSSTRLGSYVYRFNRIVHNLLYDNDTWSSTLQSLSSVHYILNFFGQVTVVFVKAVIHFFMLLYKLINVSYMSLSREMEFNADNVAVSVTGSKPIISALYRLEFGQEVFNYTMQGISTYNNNQFTLPKNLFSLMKRNMEALGKINKLPFDEGLPLINTDIAKKNFLDNRIVYKDIWATHPPTEAREKNANRILIDAPILKDSPWCLFNSPEKLQEKMTSILPLQAGVEKKVVDNAILEAFFEQKENESHIDPIYKDYYSNVGQTFASPQTEDMGKLLQIKNMAFDQLFNDDITHKLKRHHKNLYDAEVVKQISEGHLNIRSFEFDGKPYKRYYSADIYKKLKEETDAEETAITEHKQKVSNWFYIQALEKDEQLANNFKDVMNFRVKIANDRAQLATHINALVEFYQKNLSKNLTEDEVPALQEKFKKMYTNFTAFHASVNEDGVPSLLVDEKILTLSYRDSIFKNTISDPTKVKDFAGVESYYRALNFVMDTIAELDTKVFYYLLGIQQQILRKLNLN